MFFMEHTFHLKEWPTSYDYLDLGTDRHLKKKKKACQLFKENNLFVANDKI